MAVLSTIKRSLRFPVLYTAKYLGLFHLARLVTARGLRILCYHGCALADEQHFFPGTFMTPEKFEKRIRFLADRNFPVLDLGQAVERLGSGTLPRHATALTFDDGWYGTYAKMMPILKRYGFPATIYVASYYLAKRTQVFNVAVRYLLWTARGETLDLGMVDPALSGRFILADDDERSIAADRINAHGEKALDADGRQGLLRALARAVDYDLAAAERIRLFGFFDAEEARALSKDGVDLQLHTHRHRFPDGDFAAAEREIADNRDVLAPLAARPLVHFCYPSGMYTAGQLPWLRDLGIETATTTDPGFNYRDTPRLQLRRFLDAETVTDIEFEAEMCGFFELVRWCGVRI